MLSKNVYFFGGGKAEGDARMREILGAKGANLAEMTNMGLPVPPGFTITAGVSAAYLENEGKYPKNLDTEVHYALTRLEKLTGKKLGDPKNPLLVSVRPGAAVPATSGVNKTFGRVKSKARSTGSILNLGLNDQSVAGLAEQSGNPHFAWDAYRRFIETYACAVMGVETRLFEDAANAAERKAKDGGLTADDLKGLAGDYKKIVRTVVKRDFPQNVQEQLWGAIDAAFASRFGSPVAVYREANGGRSYGGTAVNVQVMVFGNMSGDSGTGVCTSRDPSTGKNEFCGMYLPNAQGRDVTAGVREPQQLPVLQKAMPLVYKRLSDAKNRLEKHFRDMQEIEFTIQQGKLFVLQTGSAGRSGAAAVKCALDMVKEGRIDKEEAILRVTPGHLDELFGLPPESAGTHTAKTAAAPVSSAQGSATDKGSLTEQYAEEDKEEKAAPKITKELETFLGWCDEVRDDSLRGEIKGFRIRVNADTPEDAKLAFELGADGVGLCRTERMFFDPKKLLYFQEAILAGTAEKRKSALKKMLPFQKRDFGWIFKAMNGKPVMIRLLDVPLYEFVPRNKTDTETLAAHLGITVKDVQAKIDLLRKRSPMPGYRGCRLAVIYPEIYDMQIEAIGLAAVDCVKKTIPAHPEIIIPLVADPAELAFIRPRVEAVWRKVQDKTGVNIPFRLGVMIETPRAAFFAKEIAEYADFFSFGINDLTRMLFALSRDDASAFVSAYLEKNLLGVDPFRTIDERGAGEMIRLAVAGGRETKGDLKCGICGEHGGDPETIDFCYRAGLSYVSCPPCRVPIARLAGAQAVIRNA